MKKFKSLNLLLAGFLLVFSFSAIKAQDETTPTPNALNKPAENQNRPNLLASLGLSPAQRQQIRRINAEKKPLLRDARQRLKEANKNLDQAIYAANINENEFQARLKDVQTLQTELSRMLFTYEFAVRKILTAEQLAKFNNLREQFSQATEGNAEDRPSKNSMQNLRQKMKLRQNQMRQGN